MPRRILLLNGPNLNLLGKREPHIYGTTTLADVESQARTFLASLSSSASSSSDDDAFVLETFQSNHEGALVDRIQEAAGWGPNITDSNPAPARKVDAIVINPGAYTHTSVAIRDALAGVDIPFVEVHISNVHAREAFRHHSYLSEKAVAVIAGLGVFGYQAALEFVARHLKLKGDK